jgi:phage regulator Rha-like protein
LRWERNCEKNAGSNYQTRQSKDPASSRAKVILDSDLAELYGVPIKRLNEQVKRNSARFPADFIFRLTRVEEQFLRSQNATSKNGRGGRRYLPFVFTEHGAIMAATVLNSKRAVQMSIFVVRAFVRMREALAANHPITVKLAELERRLGNHDVRIQDIVQTIRQLMAPPAANRRKIGFEVPPDGGKVGRVRALTFVARA